MTSTFIFCQNVNLSGEAAAEIRREGGASAQVSAGGIAYEAQDSVPAEPVYHTLNVPRGKDFFLALNDGTKVWINAETEVRYPVRFAAHERKIFVKGEVYLEVARNVEAPFTVVTAQSEVTVLGTAFNVKSYGEEDSQITLVTGKVAFVAPGGERLELEPGEQAYVAADGRLEKREVDVREFTAWREGWFVFREAPLGEVMQMMCRWYDVEVFYQSPDIQEMRFTGNLKRYSTIETFLKLLSVPCEIKYTVKGNTVVLYK